MSLYVPGAAEADALTVSFDVPPAVTEAGLSVAVTPAGAPLVVSATAFALPSAAPARGRGPFL
ncbi:hypothetical protein [Streptomyces sp. NPDC006510]|uniref:hypothetical protein n=1 Tax=Streptomyces sp. NPDC006510 TaxID=3155600 RepID=UPI0033A3B0A2